MAEPVKDSWGSRLGVILAVAGSAVGLGNFIRFPGQAAQFGGGGFMIAYAISFLIIGLPICWAEWTMGRYAGQRGYNSAAGVFHCLVPWRGSKYVGVLGAIIPLVIFMYYVVIEAWTQDTATWARCVVEFDEARAKAWVAPTGADSATGEPDTLATLNTQAESLRSRCAGHVFQLPDYKARNLMRSREQYLAD